MGRRVPLPSDRVTLHLTWVRAGLQNRAVPAGRAHAPERPGRRDLHVVAALAQAVEGLGRHAILDGDVADPRLAWIERARERLRVVTRRVYRFLQVEAEVHVREERVERPLVLLV